MVVLQNSVKCLAKGVASSDANRCRGHKAGQGAEGAICGRAGGSTAFVLAPAQWESENGGHGSYRILLKSVEVMPRFPEKVGESQSSGSGGSATSLLPRVYDELRRLAEQLLRNERTGHTFQPTALVHEAYLKLVENGHTSDWQSKTHFQAVAARAMRQILVDHARQRATRKRGGNLLRVTMASDLSASSPDVDMLALDEAMTQLEQLDERKCRVVELRFFGGLSAREAADMLDISPKTAEADWYFARAWLHKQLAGSA